MLTQRKLNSSQPNEGLARSGAPKKLTDPAITTGMKRQTTGELAAYHHGISLDDEPNAVKSFTKPVPVHPGMTERQRADTALTGAPAKAVIADAANLGRSK